MPRMNKKTFAVLAIAFLLAWITGKYLLSPAKPFLLGTGLALAAEPVTRRLSGKLPRPAAAAIGVSLALVLLSTLLVLLSFRSSSSGVSFMPEVSAVMVTMAQPPEGMVWLMVRILVVYSAKVLRIPERTPGSS